MRIGLIVGALALPLFIAPAAHSAEIEGVRFRTSLSAEETPLWLYRAALLRKFLIKGYVAGLYLGRDTGPEQVLEDVPKRLEIEYFRSIKALDFARATDEFVSRNVSDSTFEELRPRLERLNALYRDISPGDRYALTYLPGRGTELALNGESLGRIAGADFGSAIFSIWLGAVPVDAKLKRQLLEPK